jgi:hypothetical protein
MIDARRTYRTLPLLLAALLAISACSDPDTQRDRDAGAADAIVDAGDDIADGAQPLACTQVSEAGCIDRAECAWVDGACRTTEGDGVAFESTFNGEFVGGVRGVEVDGFRGQTIFELVSFESDAGVRGVMRVEGDQRVLSYGVWATRTGTGRMNLQLSEAQCSTSDGGDCGRDVPSDLLREPVFEANARYDGDYFVIGEPNIVDGLGDIAFQPRIPFREGYAQPNDGVKPANIGDRSAMRGRLVTRPGLLDALPLTDSCEMSWGGDAPAYALDRFQCDELANSSLSVEPTSFAYDGQTQRFWFRLSGGGATVLVLGLDLEDRVTAVVVDDSAGTYWADGEAPIAAEDVADADIVGNLAMYPIEQF